MTGRWPYGELDHINGEKADNRFANLREATHSQNCHNIRRRPKTNTTGFKGVTYFARCRTFRAKIHVDGRYLSLGYFATAEEAHAAYCAAATEHFGEFASIA
jgi:hypothetical protein